MELRTSRLTIRPLEEGDWPALQEIWRDFARSPYHVYDRPLPTDAPGAQALARHFAGTGLAFGVRLLESQALAGYVCFHREGEAYDLGYCFHSTYQGQGYAWESVSALLEYLASQGAAVFTAGTALDNLPSRRLLERLGFALVSTEQVAFVENFSFLGGCFRLEKNLN